MNQRIAGIVVALFVLFALSATHLRAQSTTPDPTPTTEPNPTATANAPIPTPTVIVKTLPKRQAVVKRVIDGDSIEVVFVDGGQVAMVHLANANAPESIETIECFGRESAEYAVLAYQDSPLISIEMTGEIEEGEGSGYIYLADGTFLNLVAVLFGYARYDDSIQTAYSSQIKDAEVQSRLGKTGLWRACGETEKPPRPCFLFNDTDIDSTSKREALEQLNAIEIDPTYRYAYYDPVHNEVIVTWRLYVDDIYSDWHLDEYFRLPDCSRDRSVIYEK